MNKQTMGTGHSLWLVRNYGMTYPIILEVAKVKTFLNLHLRHTILEKHILELLFLFYAFRIFTL